MKDVQKAIVTKELIRAQDALQHAIHVARQAGSADIAADLSLRRRGLGEAITQVNGGPVKMSAAELIGAFR